MRALSLAGLLILLLGNPCWAQGSLQEGSEHGWDFGLQAQPGKNTPTPLRKRKYSPAA